MALALQAAREAAQADEVPVGAVVVKGEEVIAVAGIATRSPPDPTGHAEMRAIRMASEKLGDARLTGCDLYVTLEPCVMCAGAISFVRIGRLVFAASDEKGGAVLHGPRFFEQPTCHWRPIVEQDEEASEEAAATLKAFFAARR